MRTAVDIKKELDQVSNDIERTRKAISKIRHDGAFTWELKEGEKELKKLNTKFAFLKEALQVAICYSNEEALGRQLAKVWDMQRQYNKRIFEKLKECGDNTAKQKLAEKEVKSIFNPAQLDKQESFLKYILVQ